MKGGDNTEELTKSLLEELNCQTVFTIPIFGGLAVNESVVVTWIIMAALVLLSIIFVRNLKVENPGKPQLVLESIIGWAQDFFEGILGKENKRYIPYLITVANLIGLLGFKPPTKDLNVTAGLEIINNRVSVLVAAAERPEDIDIKRAEERMRHKMSQKEYLLSQASLARAMTRLKTSRDGEWYI